MVKNNLHVETQKQVRSILTKFLKILLCFFLIGLEDAERFFVRASFGNLKGFGPFSASIPKSVIPSSWRNVQGA